MKIRTIKCTECGAEVKFPFGRTECFCSYCGTRLYLTDDFTKTVNINKNIRYTNRYIDDAKILKIQSKIEKEKTTRYVIGGLALFWIILLGIIFLMSVRERKIKTNAQKEGKICIENTSDYLGKNHKGIKKALEALGCKNIEEVHLKDGIIFYNDGDVENILVNGLKIESYSPFEPDAKIIIEYH